MFPNRFHLEVPVLFSHLFSASVRCKVSRRGAPSALKMGSKALSAIKSWSFGVNLHHKKRIHSIFFVNRNDTEKEGFRIWLQSLRRKVICRKARQRILRWNGIAWRWFNHQWVFSTCMFGWIYYYCYRLKLNHQETRTYHIQNQYTPLIFIF